MLEIQNISKQFNSGKSNVTALNSINLKVETSEFLLIKGESGSGKSTLLFILGGMLQPSSGTIVVNDKDLCKLSEKERGSYRANEIGFVFQSYHLLPYLNVFENIMLPNTLTGAQINEADVFRIVEELGIKDRLYHKPSQLSAGEKQRVALARALIINPSLILADEPTGNLDEKNTIDVMNYLKAYQEKGGTVIMVTHGHLADTYATRTIRLDKGQLIT
ncbi:ABC transporter ATP-binding protein [Snuella sedimenti]|uniref:ABC transporter ATP-binding protein n=1 Tax=Snuella sedimenti TaxID=2798802 RepID=A0A8J7IYJ0_9FLAO|nr:ABC transporter ATP-binding protein [Snuella sedimenti]MBJ6368960.1 ABC transporter ATP-binding protein [Snuella sedimenti]